MPPFIIESDDRISRIAPGSASYSGKMFATEEQLTKLSNHWLGKRLVQIWNQIAGAKPVRKFTDRKTGIDRIWNALQHSFSEKSLSGPQRTNHSKNNGTPTRYRRQTVRAQSVHEGTKKAEILKLLKRPAGATLKNLMTVTGWQAHSVRGFISANIGKRMGLQVTSSRRDDGQRVYCVR